MIDVIAASFHGRRRSVCSPPEIIDGSTLEDGCEVEGDPLTADKSNHNPTHSSRPLPGEETQEKREDGETSERVACLEEEHNREDAFEKRNIELRVEDDLVGGDEWLVLDILHY